MDNQEEEERWIEDEDDKGKKNNDDGDNDEEEHQAAIDLFAVDKQSPDDDYHLTFGQDNKDDSEQTKQPSISIHLLGIKNLKYPEFLQSTGLTLWKSSNVFANYLYAHPERVKGKCVVELGAGLGLCGIMAHKLGANRVVLTDGDTDTLRNMRRNVASNHQHRVVEEEQDGSPSTSDNSKNIFCKQLLWGKNVEKFRETWAVDPERGFDVVMGCDVAYAQESLTPLFETVTSLMSKDSGSIFLLSFVFRGSLTMDSVFAEAERHGLVCTVPCWVDESVSLKDTEGVYVFCRAES